MLRIENVSKLYYQNKGVRNMNLEVREGEITGILGRNGCGKTTLLKAILNLVAIDGGKITFHDDAVDKQYDKVAFISEEGSFLPAMNAYQYGDFLRRYYEAFDSVKYTKLLERFEIDVYDKIKNYSKGQQMKVEIAAGFSMNAKLMILDEPFTGLDVYAKEDVIKLLIEQVQDDKVIVLTTHNVEEIEQVVDRCILMEKGKIVEDVMMDDLYDKGMDIKKLMDKYRPTKY
ncbi:ABC transporter ATP-binding protein [Amedibacillus sp. YH-ame10]